MAVDIEENQLIERAKKGDVLAKNTLLRKYMPVLRQRVRVYSRAPVPQGALEGEAMRLLLYAIKKFKPGKDAVFRTFLGHSLKGLYRYVNQNKNVARIPEHRVLQLTRFKNTKRILQVDKGRDPTEGELGDSLGWSTMQVRKMESDLSRRDIAMSGIEGLHGVERLDQKMQDVMEFEYFSMSPQEQLVYDFSLGKHGKRQIKSVKEMARRTNLSTDQVYEIKRKIAGRVLGKL